MIQSIANFIKRVTAIFQALTPQRRAAIQVLAASVSVVFLYFGFGTEEIWTQLGIVLTALLQFLANLSNLSNLSGNTGVWKDLRSIVYTFAMAAGPALIVLGWVTEDTFSDLMLLGALVGTVISNLIALVSIKPTSK